MQINMIKVRFAPSPTGVPHIGNIRTALFNYFFAKAQNGKFILRIEDTDQARKVEGAEEAIEQSLLWLGISWDERLVQSEHLENYKKYAQELVEKGLARKEDGGAIRFVVKKEGKTAWIDKVGNKKIEFENKDIEDFIILKSDGFPTYHLANVVDDNKQEITHVIRGEDWVSSTPKHILLYEAFGWKAPEFVHVPNILGADKAKLSKRRGAKSVLDFKKEGILSEALLNYLMLLGWSPKNDREILSKQDFEKEFSLENINISPAIFDPKKLEWMNGEYIRQLPLEDLKQKLLDFYKNDEELLDKLSRDENPDVYFEYARTRMRTLQDFKFLVTNVKSSQPQYRTMAQKLIEAYKPIEWKPAAISGATIAVRDSLDMKTKDIFQVLTGRSSGIPFEQKAYAQGQAGTISWLENFLKSAEDKKDKE